LTQTTSRDLRVLICDDEFLLAMDMAQQFEALDAEVVGTVGKLAELRNVLLSDQSTANAAVLDIQFADGEAYEIIPLLEEKGLAVAIASGYGPEERPDRFAHIPWVTKPANASDLCSALCASLDARSASQRV
jgi:ActR/RegA family two-component response regulator